MTFVLVPCNMAVHIQWTAHGFSQNHMKFHGISFVNWKWNETGNENWNELKFSLFLIFFFLNSFPSKYCKYVNFLCAKMVNWCTQLDLVIIGVMVWCIHLTCHLHPFAMNFGSILIQTADQWTPSYFNL